MRINSVNMSALRHDQVGDKQEWCDNRDYVIAGWHTRVNFYLLFGDLWWNVGKTQEVSLYSSVNNNIAHISVQLEPNHMFSNCVLLYWSYKLYCSGRFEEVHKGNDCSYTICTNVVLQWHCLLCSTALDCCSLLYRTYSRTTQQPLNTSHRMTCTQLMNYFRYFNEL
jgi:hypothetical protein